ncbi:Fur family transcriptional regulator [Kitasatospora sp. NPDC052896]|uniref:Fur family transcriptional regulator n=1 Tax=Kitasatospora sp. NPDC052896 TaxID=3364061 RepID=UPI0037CC8CC2
MDGVGVGGERLAGADAAFAVERCRERLREHGAHCTAPRTQVMGVLADHVGHLTVGEIHRLLVEAGGKLNISTVYRTVEKLTGLGIVHAVPGRGGEAGYGLTIDAPITGVRTVRGRPASRRAPVGKTIVSQEGAPARGASDRLTGRPRVRHAVALLWLLQAVRNSVFAGTIIHV